MVNDSKKWLKFGYTWYKKNTPSHKKIWIPTNQCLRDFLKSQLIYVLMPPALPKFDTIWNCSYFFFIPNGYQEYKNGIIIKIKL